MHQKNADFSSDEVKRSFEFLRRLIGSTANSTSDHVNHMMSVLHQAIFSSTKIAAGTSRDVKVRDLISGGKLRGSTVPEVQRKDCGKEHEVLVGSVIQVARSEDARRRGELQLGVVERLSTDSGSKGERLLVRFANGEKRLVMKEQVLVVKGRRGCVERGIQRKGGCISNATLGPFVGGRADGCDYITHFEIVEGLTHELRQAQQREQFLEKKVAQHRDAKYEVLRQLKSATLELQTMTLRMETMQSKLEEAKLEGLKYKHDTAVAKGQGLQLLRALNTLESRKIAEERDLKQQAEKSKAMSKAANRNLLLTQGQLGELKKELMQYRVDASKTGFRGLQAELDAVRATLACQKGQYQSLLHRHQKLVNSGSESCDAEEKIELIVLEGSGSQGDSVTHIATSLLWSGHKVSQKMPRSALVIFCDAVWKALVGGWGKKVFEDPDIAVFQDGDVYFDVLLSARPQAFSRWLVLFFTDSSAGGKLVRQQKAWLANACADRSHFDEANSLTRSLLMKILYAHLRVRLEELQRFSAKLFVLHYVIEGKAPVSAIFRQVAMMSSLRRSCLCVDEKRTGLLPLSLFKDALRNLLPLVDVKDLDFLITQVPRFAAKIIGNRSGAPHLVLKEDSSGNQSSPVLQEKHASESSSPSNSPPSHQTGKEHVVYGDLFDDSKEFEHPIVGVLTRLQMFECRAYQSRLGAALLERKSLPQQGIFKGMAVVDFSALVSTIQRIDELRSEDDAVAMATEIHRLSCRSCASEQMADESADGARANLQLQDLQTKIPAAHRIPLREILFNIPWYTAPLGWCRSLENKV